MDKRKITLSVIAIAVLLVVLVGSTYAYWTLNGPAQTSANVQVQTGGLILRLDDTEGSITTNDVIDPNHLSFSKYFNITNESAADGYAKVLFKGLINTFVTDALVYDLEEVQSNKTSFSEPRMIITNEVVPKVSNANATLADGLLVEKGTIGQNNTITSNTKYYKLTVRYKYSDTVNQSQDLNQTLVSGFTMEEGQSSVSMTVSFNAMDNSITNPTSRTLSYADNYGELPKPKRTRYLFDGWYTDNLYTEKVESDSKALKSGNHTLYAKWIETELPEGYTQLEYLESTGTQYIDTELLIPSTGFKINGIVEWTQLDTYNIIFGSDIKANQNLYSRDWIGYYKQGWSIAKRIGYYREEPIINKQYLIEANTIETIYLSVDNNKLTYTEMTSEPELTGFTDDPARFITAYLYDIHSDGYTWGGTKSKLKIYDTFSVYFMKNNLNLVAKFIPAKCNNNNGCTNSVGTIVTKGTPGMYDTVRNKFYTNAATSGNDFTPGEELW